MPLKLADDSMCYVCGSDNAQGLRLQFRYPQKGKLTASVIFSKHHQGFQDIVHGGMIAMVLDEMMVNLAWKEGIPAVTAELTVRLKKTVKVGEKVHLEGWLDPSNIRKKAFPAHAEAKNTAGETLASASAVCVRIKQDLV